jgi:hypothetical protein
VAGTPIGPGTLLAGRYEIEDLLHDADGARFWRAVDRILARNVAVHVIGSADPRAEALMAAARMSATVTDAHFLRVLDAAREEDMVYVVNEWGFGVSLDRMLAQGALPPRRAAWVVREVAAAITVAHRHGIAHGRLLPENVVVTEAGSVKLIGFVIDAVLHGRHRVRVTGGGPLGDHESDVVNLAALLYATLVGCWPGTEGSSLPNAPEEHSRPLRPRRVRAGVPRPLDAICERVLNTDAGHHLTPIETAQEIYAALSDYIGDATGAAVADYDPTTLVAHAQLAEPVLDPTVSGAMLRVDGPVADPDATQAGPPSFHDQPTGGDTGAAGPDRLVAPAPGPDRLPRTAPRPARRTRTGPEPDRRTLATPLLAGAERATPVVGPAGSLPMVWGPDGDEGDPELDGGGHAAAAHEAGRNWLRLGVILGVGLLVLVAVILAFDLTGRATGGGAVPAGASSPAPSGSPAASARGTVLDIAGVSDFDPAGSPPEENPQLAPLAVDGLSTTAWHSVTYFHDPHLGGLKDGVGLLVDLGGPVHVSRVELTLVGRPTSLEILAADPGASRPTSTDGLKKVGSVSDAGTRADVRLDGTVRTRYLVVWLTSLPPVPSGYQGQIAEIVVRS